MNSHRSIAIHHLSQSSRPRRIIKWKSNSCCITAVLACAMEGPAAGVRLEAEQARRTAGTRTRLAFRPVKAHGPAAVRAVKRNRLVVHHGLGLAQWSVISFYHRRAGRLKPQLGPWQRRAPRARPSFARFAARKIDELLRPVRQRDIDHSVITRRLLVTNRLGRECVTYTAIASSARGASAPRTSFTQE